MPTPTGPGAIVLFGSGETAGVGRTAVRWLSATGRIARSVTILETPAGFEPNAADVAERWASFLRRQPEAAGAVVARVPARRRGTAFSPDDPALAQPLLGADLIALGAGSPTYAVRQLQDSVAWRYARAAHLSGASLLLASAAAIALGTHVLPVYELYKVGEDPHWVDGLGLFADYGLTLAIVPHWDNREGGAAVDTSRCYMGEARFGELLALLPPGAVVVGIAEHTALAVDPSDVSATVLGRGSVSVIRGGTTARFSAGASFALDELGPFAPPQVAATASSEAAAAVRAARAAREDPPTPGEIGTLAASREHARHQQDWAEADRLRDELAARGWRVEDAVGGTRLFPRRQPDR